MPECRLLIYLSGRSVFHLFLVCYVCTQLCYHLGSSLQRLLDATNDPFWRTGWVYTRMQHFVAFMYNGQVVLDTTLPLKSQKSCRISSIKPITVSLYERAQFVVKGFNLPHSTTRLLCALEGKYLAQEACDDVMDGADTTVEHDELQCIRFSCSIPNVTGRGFIEWARRANHVYGQVEIDEVRNEIASYVVKNILKL